MKKVLIALAVLASLQVANAQVKSPSAAQNALNSAKAATENPKKAASAATWLKLGKAYLDAYDASFGSIFYGMSEQELTLLGGVKPESVESVVLGGETYKKQVYPTKNLYFGPDARLAVVEITKPVAENSLMLSAEAYKKAYALDAKKLKDVEQALNSIKDKLSQEAAARYQLGDFKASSKMFADAAAAMAGEPLNVLDTLVIYNAGLTSYLAKDNEKAYSFFKTCYDAGYYAQEGDVFSKLAAIDTVHTKYYLETGFTKFPDSQRVLFDLINYYTQHKEDPEKLFELLGQAKSLDPGNASLYYVEGNIRKELGQFEEALNAYRQCETVDPAYEYGYIGEGILFYDRAIDFAKKAQDEMDDAKYQEYTNEYSTNMKASIPSFEKVFEMTKDDAVKKAMAEYLKNVYYRFQTESTEMADGYAKYTKFLE